MAGYIGNKSSVVSSGAERKFKFTITGTTTTLSNIVYTPTLVHVFHNGIRLVDGTDYTATNGTSITLTNAAENGDEVVVVSYASFQTSDTVSASAGGTFGGNINVNGAVTATSFSGDGSGLTGLPAGGVVITNDTSTNASRYITFVDANSGSANGVTVSSTKLYFNPSTGTLNATDFNSLSDAVYKTNLNPDIDSISIINSLDPVSFNWIDSDKKSYGLVAQEIEKILPELVYTNEEGIKSVSYIPLIAILIDAVKKLSNK